MGHGCPYKKSKAMKIPATTITALMIDVSSPAIWRDSKVRRMSLPTHLPTILAKSPKPIAIKKATTMLGNSVIACSNQLSSLSLSKVYTSSMFGNSILSLC